MGDRRLKFILGKNRCRFALRPTANIPSRYTTARKYRRSPPLHEAELTSCICEARLLKPRLVTWVTRSLCQDLDTGLKQYPTIQACYRRPSLKPLLPVAPAVPTLLPMPSAYIRTCSCAAAVTPKRVFPFNGNPPPPPLS